mmetsp:Transcript_141780/g.395304  ORF Transcript_141780/g.395304 Transcript_141780/m.395304 type:complete len:200 (-) Transcript_141780:3-602(-)
MPAPGNFVLSSSLQAKSSAACSLGCGRRTHRAPFGCARRAGRRAASGPRGGLRHRTAARAPGTRRGAAPLRARSPSSRNDGEPTWFGAVGKSCTVARAGGIANAVGPGFQGLRHRHMEPARIRRSRTCGCFRRQPPLLQHLWLPLPDFLPLAQPHSSHASWSLSLSHGLTLWPVRFMDPRGCRSDRDATFSAVFERVSQ